MMETLTDFFETAVGPCRVAVSGGKVVRVALAGKRPLQGRLARLPDARRWVAEALAGKKSRAPLDLSWATPFERRIYAGVRRIPAGRTRTYGEVARAAGHPGAARAVGRAMAKNRICLFIP